MASLIKSKSKTGVRRSVQLSDGERIGRPKIRLGKVTKRQAEICKVNIENLIRCNDSGDVLSPASQEWLSGISDGLRKRLEVLKIVEPKTGKTYTVEQWGRRYIDSRPDVKEITRGKWENCLNKLAVFFRGQYIEDVTTQQAKSFRVYLRSKCELSENTLRRLIGLSRQFFNAAIDAGLIEKNPFMGQSVAVRANPTRLFYVTPEIAQKVLDACPDTEWRLLFGLARWGGLRCPSEVLRLKWQDVDFERSRFTVHAIKTEHHADAGIRVVPMFPELRSLFLDAFDKAKAGDVYCITRYQKKQANLRTQLTRIITRAGLEPWPKLFHNLRSTRETELFKLTGGNVKAVCSWIGNSPEIAMQHYAQVTEADIQEAAKMSLLNDAEKTVHNPVQTTHASARTDSHKDKEDDALTSCDCESKLQFAGLCETVQKPQNYPQGDSNSCYRDENPAS